MTEDKLKQGQRLLLKIENLSAKIDNWVSAGNATMIVPYIQDYGVDHFLEFDKEAWLEFCEKNIKKINQEIENLRKEFEEL